MTRSCSTLRRSTSREPSARPSPWSRARAQFPAHAMARERDGPSRARQTGIDPVPLRRHTGGYTLAPPDTFGYRPAVRAAIDIVEAARAGWGAGRPVCVGVPCFQRPDPPALWL